MSDTADLRFCIIGAGPAGLSAADALKGLGCRRVTVLEKDPDRVGGKCRTVPYGGAPVDTGAIFVLPHYPVVTSLAKRTGVTLQRAARFVHRERDGNVRPFGEPPRPISLLEKAAEYARLGLQLVKYRTLLDRPFDEANPALLRDLSLPLAAWMKEHRLRHFQEVAYPLLRSFGFGFEEQEIPALYVFKVLPQLARGGNILSLWDVQGVDLDLVREGYGEIWRRVAADLDVRLGAEVQSVTRKEGVVRVRTAAGELEFDQLILACPLDAALDFLDASAEERRLFGAVRWLDVWQAPMRAEGLLDAVLLDDNQSFSRVGRPMILFRYGPGADAYYVFGYATPSITDAEIVASVAADVSAAGGRILQEPTIKRWKYFPHFSSAGIAAGHLSALAALQGQRNTHYVGELVANIGVESVSSHARRLVERTWGGKR